VLSEVRTALNYHEESACSALYGAFPLQISYGLSTNLNDSIFTAVFELFFLGDYDRSGKVSPVVDSRTKNIVDCERNGLVASS
jgi:hypothetical protein